MSHGDHEWGVELVVRSIDFNGYVWGVQLGGSQTVDTMDGLVGAYTYSDMTGSALGSVGMPSG